MADRELRVDVKTTGDPSGVNAVTAAINAQKAAADAASTAAVQGAGAAKTATDAQAQAQKSLVAATESGGGGGSSAPEEAKKDAEVQAEAGTILAESIEKVTEATKKKKKGTEEATEADKNAGRSAVTTAQFVDDLQYGISGVVNQLPQFAEAMGLGAGAAGVIGILGVAVNQLVEDFGFLGTSIEEVAKKALPSLRELSSAARTAQEDAKEAAADWKEMMESGRARTNAINEAADAYKKLADNIDSVAEARRRMNLAALAESDAALALELVEIELKRTKGEITDLEAVKASRQATAASKAEQFKVRQDQAAKEVADADQKIAGMQKELETSAAQNSDLRALANRLVTSKDWEGLNKEVDTNERLMREATKRRQATPAKKWEAYDKDGRTIGESETADLLWGDIPQAVGTREVENIKHAQALKDEALRVRLYQESRKKAEDVFNARQQAGEGYADLEKAQEAIKNGDKRERELQDEIRKQKEINTARRFEKKSAANTFETSTKVADRMSQIDVINLEQQAAEKAKKEEEQLRKKAEQDEKAKVGDLSQEWKSALSSRVPAERTVTTRTVHGRTFERESGGPDRREAGMIKDVNSRLQAMRDGVGKGEAEAFEKAVTDLAGVLDKRDEQFKSALKAIRDMGKGLEAKFSKNRD